MSEPALLAAACAGYYLAAGLAICIGYHRVLSHRSAVLAKWLERTLVTLGLPAGTPIQWAGNHRFHHAHADQPGDPHSPRDGFWHAHNGWYIGRKDALTCVLYALAGPLRILFDGVAPPALQPAAHRAGARRRRRSLVPLRQPPRPVPGVRGRPRRRLLRRRGLAVRVGGRRGAVADPGRDLQPRRRHRQRRAHRRRAPLRRARPGAQPLVPRARLPGRRLARPPPPLPVERAPRPRARPVGRELDA